MKKINELFDLENNLLKEYLDRYIFPCEILANINKIIMEMIEKLDKNAYYELSENVYVHKSVKIGEGVEIKSPSIVMENVELRHNAYLRGNVIIGPNSVIGNSSEIKNSIIISNCQIPHFNYVGDSILGNKVHLGAGVILANLRFDNKNVMVEKEETNLRKIGAFIGDNTQIGCNSVILPGTVIVKNSLIMPLSKIGGLYEEGNNKGKIERI